MDVGLTSRNGSWEIRNPIDVLGEPKPLSELFSKIYSDEERQAIADRHLESIEKSDASREMLIEHATDSVEKYKQQIEHYTNLLQTQSGENTGSRNDVLKEKIEEYKVYMQGYQRKLEYFENNPIEDDVVRNHLFKMTATMLGLSTQEVVEGYQKEK